MTFLEMRNVTRSPPYRFCTKSIIALGQAKIWLFLMSSTLTLHCSRTKNSVPFTVSLFETTKRSRTPKHKGFVSKSHKMNQGESNYGPYIQVWCTESVCSFCKLPKTQILIMQMTFSLDNYLMSCRESSQQFFTFNLFLYKYLAFLL